MYKGNNVDGLTETGKRHWPPKVGHVVENKVATSSLRRSSRREKESSKKESSRKESSKRVSSRRERSSRRKNNVTLSSGNTTNSSSASTSGTTGNSGNNQSPPVVGGCAGTQFGCCKDNNGNDTNIQKLDQDGQNCPPLPCGKFGCCPDGVTPRADNTGANCQTGQCQNSQFGCCFDNQTARTDALGTNCETDSGGGLSNICNNPSQDVDVEFQSLDGQTKQGKCFLLKDEASGEQTLVCTFNNLCGGD